MKWGGHPSVRPPYTEDVSAYSGIDFDAVRTRIGDDFDASALRARIPDRVAAAAALSEAYRNQMSFDPVYVVSVESPLAGAYAVGLVPLFHAEAAGLAPALVDVPALSQVPDALRDEVRRQVGAQVDHPLRAFALDREIDAFDALLDSLYTVAEDLSGSSALWSSLWDARFGEWRDCLMNALSAELPVDWFYYRDISTVQNTCLARFAERLIAEGVPGLERWSPWIRASHLVDHYWMRAGYLVISDPPVDVRIRADDATVTVTWADGWSVELADDGG